MERELFGMPAPGSPVPSVSGSSQVSSCTWAQPHTCDEPELAMLKTRLVELGNDVARCYGGPGQYLRHKLEGDMMQHFVTFLWDRYPELDDFAYSHDQRLPKVREDEIAESLPAQIVS